MNALPSPLGTYDRCWRCHQPCDSDVECPNCGAKPEGQTLAEAMLRVVRDPPERDTSGFLEAEQVNGHVFAPAEVVCADCACPYDRAWSRPCGPPLGAA